MTPLVSALTVRSLHTLSHRAPSTSTELMTQREADEGGFRTIPSNELSCATPSIRATTTRSDVSLVALSYLLTNLRASIPLTDNRAHHPFPVSAITQRIIEVS